MKATLKAPGDGTVDTYEHEQRDMEAWELLQRSKELEGRFPGRHRRNREKLAAYREERRERGEEPFQYLPAARARKLAGEREKAVPTLERLLSGPDTMIEALPEDQRPAFEDQFRRSLDPKRDKMQAANKLAAEHLTGKPAESFGESWPIVRSAIANQLWETRGVVDEATFYGLAGKHFRAEKAKLDDRERLRGAVTAAGERAFASAIEGKNWYAGWNEARQEFAAAEGFKPEDQPKLMKAWRMAHERAAKEFREIAPAARKVLATMQRELGQEPAGEGFENIDQAANALASLGGEDLEKAVYALGTLAERQGQDAGGFFAKMGEALDRGAEGYGIDLATGQAGRLAAGVLAKIEAGEEILVPAEMATDPETAARLALSAGAVTNWSSSSRFRQMEKRPLKPMEREIARQNARHMGRIQDTRQAIKDHREIVARTRSDNPFVQGLYDATASVPYTAAAFAGPTGMILNASVMAEQNYRQLKREHPGADDASLRRVAAAAGYVQSLEETVFTKAAFGRFKGLRSAVGKIGAGSLGKRFAVNAAAATGIEFGEEMLQQATLPAMQEIFRALGQDAPEVDWKQEWQALGDSAPRTFFAVLPLAMIAGGVATHTDIKNYRQLTEDKKLLEAARLSPESIDKIVAESDPTKRDATIQEAFRERDETLTREGGFTEETVARVGAIPGASGRLAAMEEAVSAEQAAQVEMAGQTDSAVEMDADGNPVTVPLANEPAGLAGEMDFWEDLQRRGVMPEVRRTDAGYEATTPEGETQAFGTLEEATTWSQGYLESLADLPGAAAKEYADFMAEYHGNAAVKFTGRQTTLKQMVDAGEVSLEQAQARAKLAGIDDISQAYVFGENRVAGKTEMARMVIQIHRDGDALTVGEEFAEGFLKRHFGAGTQTPSSVLGLIREYEEASGRSYVAKDVSDEELEQAVIEGFSDLGTEYLAGNIDADTLPAKLRQWFNLLFDTVLKKVMEGARVLRGLQQEGKLGRDLEGLLAEAMGISDAPLRWAMESEQQAEADGTMDTSGGGGVSFSVGGPTAQGFRQAESEGRTFTGKDGIERFELNSRAARFRGLHELSRHGEEWSRPISAVMEFDELFENYPAARMITVHAVKMRENERGAFDAATNRIDVNAALPATTQSSTLLHEIQHWIQRQEGFSQGGNPDAIPPPRKPEWMNAVRTIARYADNNEITHREVLEMSGIRENYEASLPGFPAWFDRQLERSRDGNLSSEVLEYARDAELPAFERYEKMPGEREARGVQARSYMTPEERAARPFMDGWDNYQVGDSRDSGETARAFRQLEARIRGFKGEPSASDASHARANAAPPAPDPILGRAAVEGARPGGGQPVTVPLSPNAHAAFGDPVSAPEVMADLTQVLRVISSKVPIRVGKVKRSALGVYWVREKLIRLRTAHDISTAAHEVAHALEDAIFGQAHQFATDATVPAPAKKELLALGKALYGDKKPNGGYHSEGFAEFFRMTVEGGHAHAAQHAPEFAKWFDAKIMRPNAGLSAAIDTAIESARRWNQQGAGNRARQSIVQTPGKVARMKEAGAEFIRTLPSRFIDMGFPLKDYVREVEERGGAAIPAGENPWDTLNARRMSHDAVTGYMVESGMLDFAGNRVGKSLAEVLAPVQGKQEDFLIYLWARRTMALAPDGRNSGLTQDDAAVILGQLDGPEFRLAAQGVYDWNNGVLEYAAQASPDFAKVVKLIRDADPGQYIPLFREFKAFDERYRKLATGAKSGQLVKRLKGSGRRIKNPVESMIAQARALVLKSQQKAILDQIIRISETVPGLGHLVFEVQPDQVPGAVRDTESLLRELARTMKNNGASLEMQDAMKDALDQLGMETADVTEAMLTFWVPAQTPKAGEDPVIPIYHNGKRRWFEVSRGVYEAINGMEVYRLPKVLDLFLGVPTRTLRLGTTGLRASFSLITNPIRDFRTLMLNSQSSANSAELLFEWMRGMGAGLLDVATAGKARSEWIDLFERLGGNMATPLGQDTRPTARAAQRLFAGRTVRTLDPRNWLDFARDILQFPEKASRIAEMKLVARDMGWDFSMPLDTATAAKLITAGKQVTTDFTAAGNVSRVLNQCMPFFNAQIQGPRAHIRAIQRDPGKFAIRGLMGTALALALWFRYRDEDWWREMPASEKYGYTYIPFDGPDGRKELLRIPRAFEADGVFMAGAQALADAWHQQEPERAAEWFGRFFGNFQPSAPPMFKDIYEQASNRNTFTGAPIIPRSETGLAPEEQFSPYTTSLSIKVGELTGLSPRRIDHSIRSYFGGVGTDIASLFGRGESGNRLEREGEMADLPVIGTLFQRGGPAPRAAKALDGMYERKDYALQRQRSRKEPETREEARARLLLTDAARAVAYVSDVIRLEWGAKERRELDKIRVEIAREAVKAFDAKSSDRAKFIRWRKQWEAAAEKAEKQAGESR